MEVTQTVFGGLLMALLLGLAGYFAWRQVQALRDLRGAESLPPEEYAYRRRQAWRRLVGCGLMLLLAGLFAGLLVLEEPARQLAEERAADPEAELTEGQRRFGKSYAAYWIVFLLVLLALLATVALDFLAIRRFFLGQQRRLQADRRAMIERQAARLRQGRNGHL